jgi:hypothetical protein
MSSIRHKKIVLGSTYKAYKKAKVYGQICLMDLDLLDIIIGLYTDCHITLSFKRQQTLERMARIIQHQNKEICSYRNKNLNDKKFLD